MAHHQRDLINKEDADRLKLPADAPAPVAAGVPPSLVLLRPAAHTSPPSSTAVPPENTCAGPIDLHLSDPAAPTDPAPAPPGPEAAPAAAASAPSRCASCRKRLGLAGFRCRCGALFCGVHRYSDRHACTFDYKAQAREAIARDNPAYKAPKLLKI